MKACSTCLIHVNRPQKEPIGGRGSIGGGCRKPVNFSEDVETYSRVLLGIIPPTEACGVSLESEGSRGVSLVHQKLEHAASHWRSAGRVRPVTYVCLFWSAVKPAMPDTFILVPHFVLLHWKAQSSKVLKFKSRKFLLTVCSLWTAEHCAGCRISCECTVVLILHDSPWTELSVGHYLFLCFIIWLAWCSFVCNPLYRYADTAKWLVQLHAVVLGNLCV